MAFFVVGVASGPIAAAATLNSPPDCTGNIIYAHDANTTSNYVFAINITTGASTVIGTGSPGVLSNALDVSQTNWYYDANGTLETLSPSGGSDVWTSGPALSANGSGENLAGGIDPANGLYYYSDVPTGTLWAYNPATNTNLGEIGTFTGGAGTNGDIDFDAQGNGFYITTNAVYRFAPPPSAPGAITIALTPLSASGSAPAGLGGIAFGGDGYQYAVNATTGTIFKLDPNSGAVVATLIVTGLGAGVHFNDLASCINPGTISLEKNLPAGRVNPSDQFNLSVTGSDISTGSTATTTGTATGVQATIAGPVLGLQSDVYTITTTNSGDAPGSTVIGDTTPSNTTYTGSDQGWTFSGAVATQLITIDPGASVTATFTVTSAALLPPGATITNTASSTVGTCSACSVSNSSARAMLAFTGNDSQLQLMVAALFLGAGLVLLGLPGLLDLAGTTRSRRRRTPPSG